MLFNSFDFGIFLPIVFLLYWFVFRNNLKIQNAFLLLASYTFYGWWDWRFLLLIVFSSLVDYLAGRGMHSTSTDGSRKLWLVTSLAANLGLLGFFKYFNFFIESFADMISLMGMTPNMRSLALILPVGISFYTFQTLSYTIDVYRGKIQPTRDIIAFFAYVSFFPQLVAGPIERAASLLPQFLHPRRFSYASAVDGLRQILWGLFKKVVIADNCAFFVDQAFGNVQETSGSMLLLASVLFAFQIYGDFSGYTDIAIGTARLFGFQLTRNFAYPYFSRDIAEFWRRWHISLTNWFKDYLYIPLGGSRNGKWLTLRNILIVFLVSGFWHGANWTFIAWGLLHALFYIPLLIGSRNRHNITIIASDSAWPRLQEVGQIIGTFFLVTMAWVLFRADSLSQAMDVYGRIFTPDTWLRIELTASLSLTLLLLAVFILAEWKGRMYPYALAAVVNYDKSLRLGLYYMLLFAVFFLGGEKQNFIYFQF